MRFIIIVSGVHTEGFRVQTTPGPIKKEENN